MIPDQGELALTIKEDLDGNLMIDGYTLPTSGNEFPMTELRDVFLTQGDISVIREKKKGKKRKYKWVNRHLQADEENTLDQYLQTVVSRPELRPGNRENCYYSALDGRPAKMEPPDEVETILLGKKYKPVAQKVKPILEELPQKFRIERNIAGDPLAKMPALNPHPSSFVPKGRYTQERMEALDKVHDGDFLWPDERKVMHDMIANQNEAFAWEDSERGTFRKDFFPPVEIPVVPHKPWVQRNIPIPPGIYQEVCKVIKTKIDAGVYEPSNSSYRSRWFCVVKKDGKKLRLVHSLEPLNNVTIAHSGIPPAPDTLAEHFSGRACGGMYDLYSGYDGRPLDERSRDLTTFQTPFGALRLVTLPMGWTNSVPIFHDDVTYILSDEIPHVTIPYIDDVPVRGPATRYEIGDDDYERIPENPGIRRFVWEHLQNSNRVIQRMKYAGGTFSGTKTVVCAAETTILGHRCTYKGRLPETDRIGSIKRWGPCKDVSDVRAFLGTVGVCRVFIKDFARHAEPLVRLTRKNNIFNWGKDQDDAQQALKDALEASPAIRPLDYSSPAPVTLAVDTSWKAVGFYIYQADLDDPKKKYIARFGSITLTKVHSDYSQPKRELFGLMTALRAARFWLLGVRNLIIETDAKYIKGMLNNPEYGPNSTINRWIEYILMQPFTLKHVAGITFGPDGLSRRDRQPGDPEEDIAPSDMDNERTEMKFEMGDPNADPPLDFEDFKHHIDTRGGYMNAVPLEDVPAPATVNYDVARALSVLDFSAELTEAAREVALFQARLRADMAQKGQSLEDHPYLAQLLTEPVLPGSEFKLDPDTREEYPEDHRTQAGLSQDLRLPLVKEWLKDPFVRPPHLDDKEYVHFVRFAQKFFLDDEGRLYRKTVDSSHKLVVEKEHRMYMLKAGHDSLGHKGFFATKALLEKRFWWPEFERDVSWFVKTCHICQTRQKTLLRIPPMLTHTPSIFQVLHADTLVMSPPSNGHKYIVHGRCGLTSWMEGKPLRAETGRAIGQWIFEDIICRWGCMTAIVTDNGAPFKAAVAWLEQKYGIKGITISAYNSRGNGKIERPHWDVRQSIYKATGGDVSKWFWFFPHVMWADRISVRKGLGCSPFFAITGAHPILPLDIVEATWLVKAPSGPIDTETLIGFRAKALAKHRQHVETMRLRVDKAKLDTLMRYEDDHKHTIKDYNFVPGDLVLSRNTVVEKSLNKKLKPRYNGPFVVIKRLEGGAYIVAELNGAVFQERMAAFRLIPYHARRHIALPVNIHEFIDVSPDTLEALGRSWNKSDHPDRDYTFDGVRLKDLDDSDDEGSEPDDIIEVPDLTDSDEE